MQKSAGPENPSTTSAAQAAPLTTTDNVEDLTQGGGDRAKFTKQQIQKALNKQAGTLTGSAKGNVNTRKRGAN